ncbi:hypothetical protein ACWC9U_10140 [Streptomyces sp. 900116325]
MATLALPRKTLHITSIPVPLAGWTLHTTLLRRPLIHAQRDPLTRTWRIQVAISVLPDPLASEIHAWVTLLRSQGRGEGEVRDYRSIRRYLTHIAPVLTMWTVADVTLREISRLTKLRRWYPTCRDESASRSR